MAPCIRLADLTPAQARAYSIVDNKLSDNSKFNEKQLAISFMELSELDLDFALEDLGFDTGEIDLIIEGLDAAASTNRGLIPPTTFHRQDLRSASRGIRGELGDHIVCASALDAASYQTLLGDDVVAAAFIDPPYGGSIEGYLGRNRKRRHREFIQGSTDMTNPELTAFLTQASRLAADHSAEGSVHFWCMDWRHLSLMVAAGNLAYSTLLNICVWTKPNGGMGSLYRSAHEFVLPFRKGAAQHRNNVQLGRYGRNRTNVWSYPGANTFVRNSEEADLFGAAPDAETRRPRR